MRNWLPCTRAYVGALAHAERSFRQQRMAGPTVRTSRSTAHCLWAGVLGVAIPVSAKARDGFGRACTETCRPIRAGGIRRAQTLEGYVRLSRSMLKRMRGRVCGRMA